VEQHITVVPHTVTASPSALNVRSSLAQAQ